MYDVSSTGILRLAVFFILFACLEVAEHLFPVKHPPEDNLKRKLNNLLLLVTSVSMIYMLLPVGPERVAFFAHEKVWGLMAILNMPAAFKVLLSFLALDLLIYFQHVLFHAVPILWRFHMVHHSDGHLDLTTGLRFHPVEMILSAMIKAAAFLALGPPLLAVLLFEVVLNGMSMFTHSNTKIPNRLDRTMRFVFVTPNMHRIHHSVIIKETNSNFGFNLAVWDRLFGTYREALALGTESTPIGLTQYQQDLPTGLFSLLKLPFTGDLGPYPMTGSSRIFHHFKDPR